VIGPQDAGRVRIESDHHRLRTRSLRAPHDLVENMPVSPMYAVEVADANERRTEVAGNVVEFMESKHPKFARLGHPERSEGSASCIELQIPRFARDDKF
jgi:hypothetical protein